MDRQEQAQDGRTRLVAGAALALSVAFIGAMVWLRLSGSDDRFADCRGGQVGGGSIGGPFTLVDETGRTVTDAEVITGPTLVYFGYTFCPDVCPLDAERNGIAIDILAERGIAATALFITNDPARDTPEVLAAATGNWHPDMIGLTGSADQVAAAMAAYKVYAKVRDPSEEYYLIDHSTFTYLMLPGTGFVDFFKRETTAEQIADAVACVVAAGA
jgi:protein SCO1/2